MGNSFIIGKKIIKGKSFISIFFSVANIHICILLNYLTLKMRGKPASENVICLSVYVVC